MSTSMEIKLTAEPEEETPEQSEERTGSYKGYAEAVRKVQKTAKGQWGWCSARIQAVFKNGDKEIGEGNAYLGNCSYSSAEDFPTGD